MSVHLPFLALFFAASLWIWSLSILPFLVLLGLLMVQWPVASFVPVIILGIGGCFFVAPWFFRWYSISVGLMFGRAKMASSKRTDIEKRLALQSTHWD
jgi:hypothetical protein